MASLRDVVLVTTNKNGSGRLLGSLANDSTAPVEVMISDIDDSFTVVVPARGSYLFAAHEIVFGTVDAPPGQASSLTVSTPAVSTRLAVPVVDGARDSYTSSSKEAERLPH
ncbi:hypothetical protein [Arthrobacter sp. Ld5]|uniref:hypothetical protein n=1 Tax=Arthrobacter sp. Ld5 TaxID=649152 RepID=UPI003EBE4B2F